MTFPSGLTDGDDQRQDPPARRTWRSGMEILVALLRYVIRLWLSGCVLLGFVSWACIELGFNQVAAESAYLIVIVLLSLMDSFATSIFLSIVAVACLDFFFIKPIFTFAIQFNEDLPGLVSFLITSLVITALVRQVRNLAEFKRDQVELLDLTFDTVIVGDINWVFRYWSRIAD